MQKTGITQNMQNYLGDKSELIKLVDGSYLTDETNDNFKEIVTHLFPEQVNRAKLLSPGSYIGGIIFENVSSYFGQPITDSDIQIDWLDYIEGILTTGYARLLVNVDGLTVKGNRVIESTLQSIKSNSYYYDGNKEYFVKLFEKETENVFNQIEYYMLVETFEAPSFKRQLFKLSSPTSYQQGELVPLDTIPGLGGLAEELTISNIDKLVIEKRIDHGVLNKIKSITYSIDRKLAEAEKNFNDYSEQFHVFSNLEIPDNAYRVLANGTKVVDFDKLGKVIMTNDLNGTSGGLEIVKNTNDLLVQSIDFIDKQIRQISAITGISLANFGIDDKQGNSSGTAKIASNGLFYKKIEKIRDVTKVIFEKFDELYSTTNEIDFAPITTSDSKDVLEEEKLKFEAGILNKRLSIMRVYDVDEAEAIKILAEINEEMNNDLSIANKNNTPLIANNNDTSNTTS